MVHWLQQLQHARGKNVVFVAVLERVADEFNRFIEWRPQLEGGKTGRELPAIVDQIVTMQWVDSAMASPFAPSCVRRQTRGAIQPRIVAGGSNNSSRPTSAN